MASRFAIAKEHVIDALDSLVPELFGGARNQTRRHGNRWAVANRWGGNDLGQMSVWRDAGRRGAWRDFFTGDHGDAIDLVAYGLTGSVTQETRMRALEWIEARFGLGTLSPEARADLTRRAAEKRAAIEAEAAVARAAQQERARKSFYGAAEISGTLAELYWRSRGIALAAVPHFAFAAFRFRSKCQYWMVPGRPTFPAILAAMIGEGGRLAAIHYTFLEPSGRSKLDTAGRGYLDDDGKPLSAKLMYPGGTGGLFIPVTYGPSGLKPNNPAAPPGIVGWTEGIEDALSAAIGDPRLRMHAAASLAGLADAPDLRCASAHLLFRDNDWHKPQAVALFERAQRRFQTFGKPVSALAMPVAWGKDVNEALNHNPGTPAPPPVKGLSRWTS